MKNTPVIQVNGFSKSFSGKRVMHDLSFTVERGEVAALLGSNGSGKTTTIRSLLGIYTADSGTLTIDGQAYTADSAHLVGYLPEERGLYLDGKVLETLAYFGELKGLSRSGAKKRALDFLDEVELGDKAQEKIKKLSSGQQQKIQIGTAIMNEPELLILDEPTKGLDPINRKLLIDILRRHQERGAAVLFSTHFMEEVDEIADRAVILKEGTCHASGTIAEIKKSYASTRIEATFTGKLPESSLYRYTLKSKGTASLEPLENATREDILRALIDNESCQLQGFQNNLPTMRDVYVSIYSEGDPI